MTTIKEIIEASWRSGVPLTLTFQTATSVPLEEALVAVRYDRAPK